MIYKCKNCDGNMVYHVEERKLYCPYCNSTDTEKLIPGKKMGNCDSCGGEWSVGTYELAGKCPYCFQYVIYDKRVEGEYEPSKILPFKIGKEQAKSVIRIEYKKKMYAPSSFLAEANLEKMEGYYVPFWLYNFNVNVNFRGKGIRERIATDVKTDNVTTSYYDIHRNFDAGFRRVPADASMNMPNEIMDNMEPYDYTELENFDPKYVSGFLGEIYNFDAKNYAHRAKEKIKSDAQGLLDKSLSNFITVTTIENKMEFEEKETIYALLPVWKYLYTYRGKEFEYYINGQTGKVIGEAPFSKGKLVIYSGAIFILAMLGMWLLFHVLIGDGLIDLIASFVGASIAAVIFAVFTTRKKPEKTTTAKTFLSFQRMNDIKDIRIIG